MSGRGFYSWLVGIGQDADSDGPKNETMEEHKRHCRAKPGNCPFEKKAAENAQREDTEAVSSVSESKITTEDDAAYEEAVKIGDKDAALRMIRVAAAKVWTDTKIIDSDGLPKVVYHGTAASFTSFDPAHRKGICASSWFAENENVAEDYTKYGDGKPRVIAAFLNVKSPYDLRDSGFDGSAEINDERDDGGQASPEEIANAAKLSGMTVAEIKKKFNQQSMWTITQSPEMAAFAQSLGHDGILLDEYGDKTIGVFEPSQIKSADIEYDDDGRLIPLSKRFDSGDDIRGAVSAAHTSEHERRVDKDGKAIGQNGDFYKQLASYDKDHRIYAVSDIHSTDLDALDLDGYGVVLIGGDISEQKGDAYGGHGGNPADVEKWFDETFKPFLEKHKDKQFVIIPGNHDRGIEDAKLDWPSNAHFLIDEEVTVNGLRIYGTPWCLHNKNGAFEVGHNEIAEHFKDIPEGVDILIAHTPPKFDGSNIDFGAEHNGHFGSTELADAIIKKKPKLVLCGHIHTGDHTPQQLGDSTVINVSKVGTNRLKGGFCGRAIGFSKGKDGNKPAEFLMDKADGLQIDKSAYPEPFKKIRNKVQMFGGNISWGSACDIIRNMTLAIRYGIEDGHLQPDANAVGTYEYAKPMIEALPDGGYNDVLKKAVKEIEESRQSGWTKRVDKIPDSYQFGGGSKSGFGKYGLFGYAARHVSQPKKKSPEDPGLSQEMDDFFAEF